MGSEAIPWNLHIWDPNGLYIWNPALYQFSQICQDLSPDAPLHSAAEGMEELDSVYSTDSLEQFLANRPETGAPQCFYPFEVRTQEETSSKRRLYNLANVLGVAQPAALQISVSETPHFL